MIRYHSTARDWWWNSHLASPERSCRAIQQILQTLKPWRDQVLSVSHQTPSKTINNHEQQKNNHQSFYGKDEASQSKNQCNRLSIYHISVRTYSITPSSQAKSDLCLICGNTVGWGISQKIDGTQVTVAIASPFPVIIYIYITTIIVIIFIAIILGILALAVLYQYYWSLLIIIQGVGNCPTLGILDITL